MPGTEINSLETQEKERRKQEILAIFESMYRIFALRIRERQFHQDFMVLLEAYKKELLNETDYLALEYDHPLRAAKALEKAIHNPGVESYNDFEKQATDSHFSPKTRALASGIMVSLAFILLCTLICAILLLSVGAPPGPALFTVGCMVGLSLYLSLPMVYMGGKIKYDTYAPVTNTINIGELVAKGLRLFKPVIAQPVDDVSPEYAASRPVAEQVSVQVMAST